MQITMKKPQSREIAPAGMHYAVCYCIVDLGTQRTPYGLKAQLYLGWELPNQLTSRSKPHTVGQFYNLVTDPRGTLRQELESWFGRAMETDELVELNPRTVTPLTVARQRPAWCSSHAAG
jgi:hypothetical protein